MYQICQYSILIAIMYKKVLMDYNYSMETKNRNDKLGIVIALISIAVVGGLGTLFVNLGTDWFNGLVKPSEWIPNILIPIVWSVIYLTFGIILWLWIKNQNLPRKVTALLITNGVFNILWCLVFFTLNQLFLGVIVIILNLIFAVKLILEISKTKDIYTLILTIYPLWLGIATTLNLAVWILN